MKKLRFPWIECLIFIFSCILIWLLGYPQYKESIAIAKKYAVRVNIYSLRAGIENYAAYNNGVFPSNLNEIKNFLDPIINPYTGKTIEIENIQTFQYTKKEEHKEITAESKNGRMRGEAGEIAYGYFMDEDSLVSAFGVIGFDEVGEPLSEKLLSKKIEVFVLYE